MSDQQIIKEFQKFSEPEKRELLMALKNTLTNQDSNKTRSLLELSGLGKEIWKEIDVEEYIRNERNWYPNQVGQ